MLIRPYTEADLATVRSLHERFGSFPLPRLTEPQYIVKEVAIESGEVIGFGAVRITSEILTILDLEKPVKVRAEAVNQLMQAGIFKSQKLGIDEMHCFLTGDLAEGFARYLKRHLGFEDCPGKALTLIY